MKNYQKYLVKLFKESSSDSIVEIDLWFGYNENSVYLIGSENYKGKPIKIIDIKYENDQPVVQYVNKEVANLSDIFDDVFEGFEDMRSFTNGGKIDISFEVEVSDILGHGATRGYRDSLGFAEEPDEEAGIDDYKVSWCGIDIIGMLDEKQIGIIDSKLS